MMDVNQRKMFKTRPARDKLNRMGGIMASSAPLMNTVAQYNQKRGVQNFQLGGGVQLPLLAEDQAKRDLIEAVDQRFPQRNVFGRGATGGARPGGASLLQRTRIPLSLAARSTVPGALALGAADLALGEGVDREGIMANTARVQPLLAREGFTQKQFDALSPEQQQSLFQTEQDRRFALSTVGGSIGQEFAILPDMLQNLYEDVVGSDVVQRGLKATGVIDPTSQFQKTKGRRDVEEAITKLKAENRPFDNINQFRASLPLDPETEAERVRQSFMGRSTRPPNPAFDSADVTRADPIEAATDIDKTTAIAATETGPETGPEKEPTPAFDSADGTGTEEKRLTAEQAAATESGQFLDEDSDAITEEARIANVINSNDQELQQGELQRLMAEFTENAPQYEGMGKGLALAKIGFAMAAGKSPNAIENIASALDQGADLLIKDKKDRDSFKRQVELSSLQYGLSEIGKRRAQARTDARTFRAVVPQVDGVMTLSDGTKVPYKANETVNVPMTEIIARNGQLPEGLSGQDKDVYLKNEAAILERAKEVNKRLTDARNELILDDKRATELRKEFGGHVDKFLQAEVGARFIEEALLTLAEDGEYVLGATGAAADLLNKTGNFLGITTPKVLASRERLTKRVRLGFQKLIKSYFTGSQSANSISNFDVTSLADAYIDAVFVQNANGTFSLATKDEDVLAESLQEVLKQFGEDQRTAMADIKGIEEQLNKRILPGQGTLTDPYSSGTAETIIISQRERLNPFIGEQEQRLPEFRGKRSQLLIPVEIKEEGGMKRFRVPGLG